MKLLHVLPTLDPNAGGPAESVKQRSALLHRLGHTIEVVTLDGPRDRASAPFPVPVHVLGPSVGNYRYSRALIPFLKQHAGEYDAVIVDGVWQYSSFGTWLALRHHATPYFVFPHGMLDPWFKDHYPLKHLKKCLYWPWGEYRVLRDARAVFFTTEEERLRSRQSFSPYRMIEATVSLGTKAPPTDSVALGNLFLGRHPELAGCRCLLFLGRLHEKKGCDLLIRAFANVHAIDPTLRIIMAGPDQTGWSAYLQGLAGELGVAEKITWTGMLRDDLKWGAFYCSEAFVLPSHQENFGVAVAEALGCGRPVLISDKINIWREIEEDGAGLVAPDTVAGTEYNLRRWLDLGPDRRALMSMQASATFERRFTQESMTASLLDRLREFI